MWKTLTYYDSCMDLDEIERLKGEPLKKLIKEYGSWSITDKNWEEKDWDFVGNLARIHKDLVLPVLFSMTVVIDNKNSSQYTIKVRWSFFKPGLQLLSPSNIGPRGPTIVARAERTTKLEKSSLLARGCFANELYFAKEVLLAVLSDR